MTDTCAGETVLTAPAATALVAAGGPVPLLLRHADERADRVAVRIVRDLDTADGQPALSFGALDRAARAFAGQLSTRVERGDRILLLQPTGLEIVVALLGCWYAGAVAVPAPAPGQYAAQQRRATAIAADSGATLAVIVPSQLEDAEAWLSGAGLGTAVLVQQPIDPDPAPSGYPVRAPGPDDVAVLQYTSGSTGDPKGVTITHANLVANAASLVQTLGLDAETGFGGWIPLFHDMGLMGQLLPGLMLGSSVSLMSPTAFLKRPQLWLHLIARFGVGYSAAPDFAYDLCSRRVTPAQSEGLDLSGWRFAANGSEPIHPATLTRFADRFAEAGFRSEAFAPCYGMAESTVFVSGSTGRPPRVIGADPDALGQGTLRRAGTGGLPLVSCGSAATGRVRIVDPESRQPLPEGRIGEIWLAGPSVARGYWGRPDATAETFGARTADGDGPWLRSGDLGVLDGGELIVTGRIKDVMILSGRNIYPQDVEHEVRHSHDVLALHSGAAFSIPCPDERVVVVHEIRGRRSEQEFAELTSAIRYTVASGFGVPTAGVVLVKPGAVAKTTSGKVRRSSMREQLLAGQLAAVYADLDPAAGIPAVPSALPAR
ncbi:MAG TPA: fatty acyl-AMP ligase [Jatrophihabitans sp.]|nr:fatty acyl-AMP ligase [Jatrophihabitans sp.]